MPKSSKPRKKYRPLGMNRRDRADTVMTRLHVSSTGKMDRSQVRDLQLAAHSALDSIEKGAGTEEDLNHLALSSNVAIMLAEAGMGPEFIPKIREAQHHLVALLQRRQKGESLALTGPGILALRTMLEVYDAQLEHPEFTTGHAYTAYMRVLERMAQGHVLEIPE